MRKKKTSYILVLSIAVVLLFRSTIAVSAQNQTDYVAWSDYMAYERFQSKYDYLMNTDLIWSNKLFSIDQRKKFTDIVSEFLYQRISRPNPDRVFAHWLSEKKNRDSSLIFLFTAQLSAANMEFSDALSHLNRAKYGLESTNLWALSADIDTDIRRRSTWQQQVKDFALFDYNLPFQGVGQIKSIVFSSTNESIFFTDKVNHYRASGLNCFKQNMDTLSFGEGSPKECQLSSIYGDTYYFSCRNELRGDLDIFKAKLNGTIFSDFKGLPSPINTVADETDFHRSNNGEFAFFSSSRPGGLGGLDIYVAIQKELQQGMPVKYMLNLNTMADDRVTSLGDGGELFLSTPGRNLQQKKEFYIAQSASDSDFTISNLGYPINSFLDNDEVLAYTNGVLLKTFGPELQKKIIGVFLNSTVPDTIFLLH